MHDSNSAQKCTPKKIVTSKQFVDTNQRATTVALATETGALLGGLGDCTGLRSSQ
jgi:hypothetical protein